MSNETNDAVAAFLARGGKISKVAEGESLGLTARDWAAKVRDPKVERDLGPAKTPRPVARLRGNPPSDRHNVEMQERNWKAQAEYDEKWGTVNGYAPWQYNREE